MPESTWNDQARENEWRLCELLRTSIIDRYNLDGITLPTATNVRTPAIGWLDTIDHSLSDFAAILAIRPTAVGLAHRIAIHCRPGHEPREAQAAGPVLRLTGGFRTPTINLYVAPDAKDASARLFAHQWAQALLHELAASLPPGPALAAALVQALRHGPPGNDIDTTDHSKRIAALGVPQSKHDDVLVATSFEAFVEHERERRELDTAWLWRRAPNPGGSDEEHRCSMQRQGWPTDADARNAIAYWRQLLQAIRFGLNGMVATEGASAISRSLLEQQRRKRRAGQLERSYAAITLATHESGNNPASSLAVLSTSGDDAALLVTDAEKTLFLLDYRRELMSDGIPAEPLDREGIRLAEIACERHAVGCAVAAQAGSVTVRCTYDRKGRLQMDDDEPGNETSWTHEASLRKRTEHTFAGRLTALLEPAAGPPGHRILVATLPIAFLVFANRVLVDQVSERVRRRFLVTWKLEGRDRQNPMQIYIHERRKLGLRPIISQPTSYAELIRSEPHGRRTAVEHAYDAKSGAG